MSPIIFPLAFTLSWLISLSLWPALGIAFIPLPLTLLIGLATIQKQQDPAVIAWLSLTIVFDLFFTENPLYTAVIALICWVIGEVIIRSVLARRSYYATASYTAIMSTLLVLSSLLITHLTLAQILVQIAIFWLIMNLVSVLVPWKTISLRSQYEYK